MSNERAPLAEKSGPVEEYAGGEIRAYHGRVNKWLLLVYAMLFLWALYYLMGPFDGWTPTFQYWGGVGPGLAGEQAAGPWGLPGVIAFGIMLVGVITFFGWVAILTWKK
jgi:hypothetical protein